MFWKIALLVALLYGAVSAIMTAVVAEGVTRMDRVSDREGGRGMAVFFIFASYGLIGGFLFGLLGTSLLHAWNGHSSGKPQAYRCFPSHTAKDLQWTAPTPMRLSELSDPEYTYTDVLLRFREVKVDAGGALMYASTHGSSRSMYNATFSQPDRT